MDENYKGIDNYHHDDDANDYENGDEDADDDDWRSFTFLNMYCI